MRQKIIGLLFGLLAHMGGACAAPVSYQFSGVFTDAPGGLGSLIGATFSGTFSYDTTWEIYTAYTNENTYRGSSPSNATFNFLGYTLTGNSSDTNYVQVRDWSTPTFDVFRPIAKVSGVTLFGYAPNAFSLLLVSNTGTGISSTDLPVDPNFAGFDQKQFSLFFSSQNEAATGLITDISVISVPEPESIVLFVLALSGLLLAQRRAKTRS